MKKDELKKMLAQEIDKWANKSFEELNKIKIPMVYESGEGNKCYQVEISILEKNKEYIQLDISVTDGSLSRYIKPLSKSIIIYSDGGVDK